LSGLLFFRVGIAPVGINGQLVQFCKKKVEREKKGTDIEKEGERGREMKR
jgi:hypothetical protein